MPSYVDDNLLPTETVLYRAHRSLWPLSSFVLLGIGLLVVAGFGTVYFPSNALWFLVALALVCFLWVYILRVTTEFAVTDRRIIAKSGLIARDTVEMFLDKVESLNVDQTIIGRIFNYGTIKVRGTGSTEEPFRNISGPMALRKQFMAAADKYRTTLKDSR
jgi:uncharacterized membrane protein YdbT with pleckstrin-like domain